MKVTAAAPQIGDPVRYDQSFLPVFESKALKKPSWSPAKTTPDAVDITPASVAVSNLCSHLIAPVFGSIARNALKSGSASLRMPPPIYERPTCHSCCVGV